MEPKRQPVTRIDYCQYLLISQINYTLTNFADHTEHFSHDAMNRYLAGDQVRPRLVWENVQGQVVQTPAGYVLFDDTIIDKNFSTQIELVRRQYSGNAHGLVKGIGVVTCVYVNPTLDQFWIIDFRIYAPESDGKTKLAHVHDMLTNCVYQKQLQFGTVLMDTWYATSMLMLLINDHNKIFYCPMRKNRLAKFKDSEDAYQPLRSFEWSEADLSHGKLIRLKGMPEHLQMKLFSVAISPNIPIAPEDANYAKFNF